MIRLQFDSRLYTPKAVSAAASAFQDIAAINVREDNGYIVAECEGTLVRLNEECGGDFEGELANLALWEMKK